MGHTAAVRWLGHATTLIELDGSRLLTDPVLTNRIGHLVRFAEPVDAAFVDGVDCVLLSHLHADHADLGSLRRVTQAAIVLAPAGAGGWLADHGVPGVRELAAGGVARVGELEIWATPAVHDERRRPLGGPRAAPVGYVVRGSRSVYFAGDTDLFDQMAQLGKIDVALLPIWGWGPSVGPGHLDPERAARAAAMIAPRTVIPIHWGTFAIGRPARRPRDPGRPVSEFAALVSRYAPDVLVSVLAPGERLEL